MDQPRNWVNGKAEGNYEIRDGKLHLSFELPDPANDLPNVIAFLEGMKGWGGIEDFVPGRGIVLGSNGKVDT